MDLDLIKVIQHIKSIKQDLYAKHKPEMVNGIHVMNKSRSIINQEGNIPEHENEPRSKAYESLMKQKRKLTYKKSQPGMNKEALLDPVPNPVVVASPINFHSVNGGDGQDTGYEFKKPWHKLPNNLKIHSIIKFIDRLSVNLTIDQVNQLRYLLISAITEKKITKVSDVDYDVENGQIRKIHKLTLVPETNKFRISDTLDSNSIELPKLVESPSLTLSTPSKLFKAPKLLTTKIVLKKAKEN